MMVSLPNVSLRIFTSGVIRNPIIIIPTRESSRVSRIQALQFLVQLV